MIPQTRKFFVIVVHYGNPDTTTQAVSSLLDGEYHPHRVLVIDHAHTPLSPPTSRAVTVIRPSKNSGYASGCNLGLGWVGQQGAAPDDIVLCVNNDVVFPPNALKLLVEWWERQGCRPALVSPAVRESSGVVRRVSTVNWLTGRAYPYRPYQGWARLFGLPYLHGACVSAPFSTWMALGGWPVGLGMYWEDVVLSWRARKGQVPLKVVPLAKVSHHARPQSRPSGQHLYYLVRNGAWVMGNLTPPGIRHFWQVLNWARQFWHRWRRHTAVVQALADSPNLPVPPVLH